MFQLYLSSLSAIHLSATAVLPLSFIFVVFHQVSYARISRRANFLQRAVVNLCVSDANKDLILVNESLLALLAEALLLDPTHVRQDQRPAVKAAIQADAVEAILQLACYEPGRALLATRQDTIMAALRALISHEHGGSGCALSTEAECSASGALLALEGHPLTGPTVRQEHAREETLSGGDIDDGASLHVMMSYQWNVQNTIKLIVECLRKRQYRIWIDIEKMKGSTIDAMSAAIDSAAALLYGVSLAYKESANCRLEANYAYRQSVYMIPLMM